MAGFNCNINVTRNGAGIPGAEIILGTFGLFTGDGEGEVEIEIDDWGEGQSFISHLCVTDPRDGARVFDWQLFADGGTYYVNLDL